ATLVAACAIGAGTRGTDVAEITQRFGIHFRQWVTPSAAFVAAIARIIENLATLAVQDAVLITVIPVVGIVPPFEFEVGNRLNHATNGVAVVGAGLPRGEVDLVPRARCAIARRIARQLAYVLAQHAAIAGGSIRSRDQPEPQTAAFTVLL